MLSGKHDYKMKTAVVFKWEYSLRLEPFFRIFICF
jgi:hypothetical protein